MEQGAYLDNGFIFIEEIPLELLNTDYLTHRRLAVFAEHGTQCVCCSENGTRLVRSMDMGGGIHVDLYSDDWVLMTVDHIVAKANGGGEELSNKQPMCTYCNSMKGHKDMTVQELRERRYGIVLAYITKYLLNALAASTANPMTCRSYVFTSGGSSRSKNSPFNTRNRNRRGVKRDKTQENVEIVPQFA